MSDLEIKCVRCSKFINFRSLDDLAAEEEPIIVVNEYAEIVCFSKTAPLVYGYTPEQAAELKVKDFNVLRRPRAVRQLFKMLWKLPNRDDYIFRTTFHIKKIDGTGARIAMTSKLHTINNDLFAVCSGKIIEDKTEAPVIKDIQGEMSDKWDCVIDRTGNIVATNPERSVSSAGFASNQLARMRLQDLFPEDEGFQKISAGLSDAKQFYLIEQNILTANGQIKKCFVGFMPLGTGDDGEPRYKVFFVDPAFGRNDYYI